MITVGYVLGRQYLFQASGWNLTYIKVNLRYAQVSKVCPTWVFSCQRTLAKQSHHPNVTKPGQLRPRPVNRLSTPDKYFRQRLH